VEEKKDGKNLAMKTTIFGTSRLILLVSINEGLSALKIL
jgi:hypothetical protein